MCGIAADYLRLKAEIGEMARDDSQMPNSYSAYADLLMEILLSRFQTVVEDMVGASLLPTHSYARLYRHGDQLKPHTDRPACEIVASITLGREPDSAWSLYIGDLERTSTIDLAPGDCVVYAGSRTNHWREAFKGYWQAQLTLHYVRRDGQFAEWAFDKRPGLGRHVGTRRR